MLQAEIHLLKACQSEEKQPKSQQWEQKPKANRSQRANTTKSYQKKQK